MATLSKQLLSNSTNGSGIQITATSPSSPTLVHQTPTGSIGYGDEIWLYANNQYSSSVVVNVGFGSTAVKDVITSVIPPSSSMYLMIPGQLLNNSGSVQAWATNASSSIFGWVNRFTP